MLSREDEVRMRIGERIRVDVRFMDGIVDDVLRIYVFGFLFLMDL